MKDVEYAHGVFRSTPPRRGRRLTNNPNLYLAALNAAQEETTTLDKAVLEALGLAANATAADAVVAIGALKASRDTALNSAQHPDPEKFVPAAQHQLALNRVGELETAEKGRREAEIVALVDDGVAKGKIAPAARDEFLAICRADFDRGSALIAKLPVLTAASGSDRKAAAAVGGQSDLTAEELAMCRAFGNMDPAGFAAARDGKE